MRLERRTAAVPAAALAVALALAATAGARAADPASVASAPAAAPATLATSLRVAVELEPATLAVGDPVTATLSLTLTAAEAQREATFPDWSKGWGEAEVLQAGPVERTTATDGTHLVQRLRLTAWKSGKTALPPVEVQLSGEPALHASTPPDLALEVRSVIASDDKELKPAPPSPPRSLAVARSFWWALAIGGALAAGAAVLAWKRRREVDPLAAPELAPLAELERALGLLAAEPPAGAFAHLSQALRRYFGRRLGFRALESTTTEVQRRLAALRLDPALVQRSVRVLRLSDQIKFARRPAESSEAAARITETREIAAAIESHLAPLEEAAASAPPASPGGIGSPGSHGSHGSHGSQPSQRARRREGAA
ncbi:MAG: hypothetical protein ABI689_14535 [Thermoanaerobaculia bacterium]